MDDEIKQKPKVKLARDIAKSIIQKAGIVSAPVNMGAIVNLIKDEYNLSVDKIDLGNIDGIQASVGTENHIAFNSQKHPHRQRFTLAHEIGHLLLGHTRVDYKQVDLTSSKPEEIEANKFAAELLMPMEFLKKDISAGMKPKELYEKYLVSEEALWWHLKDLNLINKL